MGKTKKIIGWILRALISIGLILAALGKLSNQPAVIDMFNDWGYPQGFHIFIGGIEALLAILLLIPRTLKIAVYAIAVLMIGALLTHLFNDPIVQLLRPGVFLMLLAGVYYLFIFKKA